METNKPQKLSDSEQQVFISFIGKAVLENVSFPSQTIGTENVTVQELLNNKTIYQLDKYGEFIEKTFLTKSSKFGKNRALKTWGSINAENLVDFICLCIKHKEYETHAESVNLKIYNLEKQLENLKSPDEIKADLNAKLAELKSEV